MRLFYHFYDRATGEYFFIVNDNLCDAIAHANGLYDDPCLIKITDDKDVVITLRENVW